MRWRDGAQGVFLCNNNAGSRREEYVFHAPDETCSVTGTGLTIERKGQSATTVPLPMQGDGYAAEHDAFLQAIRSGAEPLHSLAAIAPSLFLAELIEDGFSGRVQLPQTQLRAAPSRRAREGKSILVAPSPELQTPLASLLSQYRLVTLEDVASRPLSVPILSRPFWAAAHPRCPQIFWTSFRSLPLSALWPCRSRVMSPKYFWRAVSGCSMEAQLTQRAWRSSRSDWRSSGAVAPFSPTRSCAQGDGAPCRMRADSKAC